LTEQKVRRAFKIGVVARGKRTRGKDDLSARRSHPMQERNNQGKGEVQIDRPEEGNERREREVTKLVWPQRTDG